MLTFPTSHALTDALITAIQTPDLTVRLPIVLFLYEVANTDTEHLIRCHVVRPRHSNGAEGLDTTIVGRIEALTHGHTETQGPIPALIASVNVTTGNAPGFRMLACAALDDDIVIAANEPHGCRRLDAVDIDGRVYQLTRYHAETHPVVTVDDADGPRDTPATIPPLQTALKIAVRLASRA
ncbi:hypothetical protein [Krasilnikovia sp. MM14-A1259]|uniref:hypothetical protein n=1 Tax=Krasilnikovia sp. MM14-A1259 TaxID=3373539 RepID=UPI00399CE6A1